MNKKNIKFKKGLYMVITDRYNRGIKGRIGHLEAGLLGNKYGNEMFYPAEGKHPYCICLPREDLVRIG